jgi:hypothetical protein
MTTGETSTHAGGTNRPALSLAYLGLLFAVAYFGVRAQLVGKLGRPPSTGCRLPLQIWTFYGAVGRASTAASIILICHRPGTAGRGGLSMLRKMVRLAKQRNVTSIADFLASRYGKSAVGVTHAVRHGRRAALHRPAAPGRVVDLQDIAEPTPLRARPACAPIPR